MKAVFRYLFLLVMFCSGIVVKAQNIYPFQLNAVMLPPYTNCLGDYLCTDRIQLTAILRDMTYYDDKDRNVRFTMRVSVKQGNTVYLESQTSRNLQVTLNAAQMINRLDAKTLLNPANLRIIGSSKYEKNGWCLPEGGYEFVYQLFDYHDGKMPLSEPFSLYCYLQQAEPPVGVMPEDGTCVSSKMGGVQFQWMTPIAIGPVNRSYLVQVDEIDIPENQARMFSEYDPKSLGSDHLYNVETFNNNFAFLQETAAGFVDGKKYKWRVKVNDNNSGYSSADNNYYAYKNEGYSQWYTFIYGDHCAEQEPYFEFDDTKVTTKVDKDFSLTLLEVKTEKDTKTADITWKIEKGEFEKYNVYLYKQGDESNVTEIKDILGFQTIMKNIEPGITYECYVVGFGAKDNDGLILKSPKSNVQTFKIEPTITEDKCEASLDHVDCDDNNLVNNLKKDDVFYANGKAIKLNEDPTGNNGLYSGKGVYTADFLTKIKFLNLGLEVTFENIKIHKVDGRNELCQGIVNVTSDPDDERNLELNLNELLNKMKGAEEAENQKNMSSHKASNLEDIKANIDKCKGSLVETEDGKLYSVSMDADIVEVGTIEDTDKYCDPPSYNSNLYYGGGLNDESGYITFEQTPNLNDGKYDPFVDMNPGKFSQVREVYKGYTIMGKGYYAAWIAMVQGDARVIRAKFVPSQENAPDFDMNDVEFYCYSEKKVVTLKKKYNGDNTFDVTIFGGEPKYSLDIFARVKSKKDESGNCDAEHSKTIGYAKVYNMSYETNKVLLVPLADVDRTKIDLKQLTTALEKEFTPLGKHFEFEMTEQNFDYTTEAFNTSEDVHFFSNETEDMKRLQGAYANEIGDKNLSDYSACLFLMPQALKQGLQGYMPRGKSVGYIFVGSEKDPVVTPDIIAHELCHGLYGLEHTFIFSSVGQGAVPENVMDYSTNSGDKYLSKYYQWAGLQDSSRVFLVFDKVEDSEGYQCFVKAAVKTGIATVIEKVLLPSKEPDTRSIWRKAGDVFSDFGSQLVDDCAGDFKNEYEQAVLALKQIFGTIKCINQDYEKENGVKRCLCDNGMELAFNMASNLLISRPIRNKFNKLTEAEKKQGLWNFYSAFKSYEDAKDNSAGLDVLDHSASSTVNRAEDVGLENMSDEEQKAAKVTLSILRAVITGNFSSISHEICGLFFDDASNKPSGTDAPTDTEEKEYTKPNSTTPEQGAGAVTEKKEEQKPQCTQPSFSPSQFNLPSFARLQGNTVSFESKQGVTIKLSATISDCKVVRVSAVPKYTVITDNGKDLIYINEKPESLSESSIPDFTIIGDNILIKRELIKISEYYTPEKSYAYFNDVVTKWLKIPVPSLNDLKKIDLKDSWSKTYTNCNMPEDQKAALGEDLVRELKKCTMQQGFDYQLKLVIRVVANRLAQEECSDDFNKPFAKPTIKFVDSRKKWDERFNEKRIEIIKEANEMIGQDYARPIGTDNTENDKYIFFSTKLSEYLIKTKSQSFDELFNENPDFLANFCYNDDYEITSSYTYILLNFK